MRIEECKLFEGNRDDHSFIVCPALHTVCGILYLHATWPWYPTVHMLKTLKTPSLDEKSVVNY